MNTIVRYRLRQEGGDVRWQNPTVYQSHETPEYPNIGETVSPPESVGGGDCKVTEITELLGQEIDDGSKATIITVILRRSATT
jgi:hypothetical protein